MEESTGAIERLPNWGRFDAVLAICSTRYPRRRSTLISEFSRVGISQYETVWKFPTPLLSAEIEAFGYDRIDSHAYFSRTMAHYRALKTAYELGRQNVLIFEDIARLIKDVSLLTQIVTQLPDDYDCAKFEWIPNRYTDSAIYDNAVSSCRSAHPNLPEHWVRGNGIPTSGNAMIAYSRKGLARKIELMERYAGERRLITADDYEMKPEFEDGLVCYLATPIAAIQDTSVETLPYGTSFTHLGTTESYAGTYPAAHKPSEDSSFENQIRELIKAVSLGRSIRVALVGGGLEADAALFSSDPSVSDVYLVTDDTPETTEQNSAYTVYSMRRALDDRDAPDVDLVYICSAVSEHEDLLAKIRASFGVRTTFCGNGYSTEPSATRTAVDAVFGLPDQDLSLNIWIVFGGRPTKTRNWRFLSGRIGNQMYYLLQAYRLGPGNKYAVPDDDVYAQFASLGALDLVSTVDDLEKDCVFSWGQQWNIGTHYTKEDVHAFVKNILLRSHLYAETVRRYGLDESTVAIHVRCTDFLTDVAWSPFDRIKYVKDAVRSCLDDIGAGSGNLSARVFSDDIEAVKRVHGDTLTESFASIDYVRPGRSTDDLMRLATHRNKILFNSTYSTWAGHIGDAIFGVRHRVIMPSAFYRSSEGESRYIGGMSILASPAWKLIPVTLYDGVVYPE